MRKSIGIFGLCLMLTMVSPISVFANAETMLSPEEELEQLLEVNESQYHLETRGQAELISPGHELLDGKYDNGELVNGSVYYSVEDALAGVKRDKLEAKSICRAEERVSPPTGTIKGPDDKGPWLHGVTPDGIVYSYYKNPKYWHGSSARGSAGLDRSELVPKDVMSYASVQTIWLDGNHAYWRVDENKQ